MGSKDHAPRMGRAAPQSRGRQEPLWSEAESDDLFDPDLAFEEARARLDAEPQRPEPGDEPGRSDSTDGELATDPTDGPVRVGVDSSPPPDAEISGDLPVPLLDDAEDDDGAQAADDADSDDAALDAGGDTHVEGPAVDPSDRRFETAEDPRIPAGRSTFKIGEVARIVGVQPYVLRYWESELEFVSPQKTEAGQRRFRREDVATLLQVRRLRHDAGLTMAQTRALIREGRGSEVVSVTAERTASPWIVRDAEAQSRVRAQLLRMREAVLDLLHAIEDKGEEDDG